jgi:peptidoglycan hydrolase CwlO-like protein
MQNVMGADLKDLQSRYADMLARKDSQDRLIAQLALRLEEASGHLQKLALPEVMGQPRAADSERTPASAAVAVAEAAAPRSRKAGPASAKVPRS